MMQAKKPENGPRLISQHMMQLSKFWQTLASRVDQLPIRIAKPSLRTGQGEHRSLLSPLVQGLPRNAEHSRKILACQHLRTRKNICDAFATSREGVRDSRDRGY